VSTPEYFIGPESEPDRYRIGLPVGAGSEGLLYRGSIRVGETTTLDVAIKMLHPNHRARLDEWNQRWASQIELLRSLQVPGVVPVRDGFAGPLPHEAGHADPGSASLYLVMNWIDGEPLDEWSSRHPEVSAEERLKLLLPVAGALDLMHSGQATGGTPVIHGDVKPSNIVVRTNDETVLVDFGLVRLLPDGRMSTGVTGTPGYVAPEVRDRGEYTAAADRYALGGVAYFLLTGQEPASGESNDQARLALGNHFADRPELIEHVMAMLDRNPEMRPRVLANWCAQLRQSSLDQMYQPDRLPPIAPLRVESPSRITVLGGGEPAKITVALPVVEVQAKGKTPQPTLTDPPVVVPTPTRRRSRRLVALSATFAMVLIASAAGVLALRSGGSTPTTQNYSFAPAILSSGLVVARTWSMSGSPPVLSETLVLTNSTAHKLDTTYDEVIPSSIATNVTQISFSPRPSQILRRDPVVRYDVNLASGASQTMRYSVRLPGSGPVSMNALVESMQSALGGYDSKTVSAVLSSLSVSPTSLHLTEGSTQTVMLSGLMSNGAKASPTILHLAKWHSTNPSVATVSNGTVSAVATGTTAITARSGSLIGVVSVQVVAASGAGGSSSGTAAGSSSHSGGGAGGSASGTGGGAGGAGQSGGVGGVVSGLTATPDGSGQISVSWQCDTVSAACSGGQTLQSFSVTLSPTPPTLPGPPAPAAGKTSYSETIGGLTNGTSYTVAVAACTTGGCTPSAQIPKQTVTPFGAPGSPNLTGSANGTTITWTWTPPAQSGGRPIATYDVVLDGTSVANSSDTSFQEGFGYSQSHTLTVTAENSGGLSGPAASVSVTTGSAPQAPPPTTYAETTGGVSHTWTDYADAGGSEGPSINSNQTVQIACKVTGFRVADGNTWWYRIASSPWNNQYYVSADAFYNDGATSGSLNGTPFVDPNVPNC
jgi:serine/threonine protein kinase